MTFCIIVIWGEPYNFRHWQQCVDESTSGFIDFLTITISKVKQTLEKSDEWLKALWYHLTCVLNYCQSVLLWRKCSSSPLFGSVMFWRLTGTVCTSQVWRSQPSQQPKRTPRPLSTLSHHILLYAPLQGRSRRGEEGEDSWEAKQKGGKEEWMGKRGKDCRCSIAQISVAAPGRKKRMLSKIILLKALENMIE